MPSHGQAAHKENNRQLPLVVPGNEHQNPGTSEESNGGHTGNAGTRAFMESPGIRAKEAFGRVRRVSLWGSRTSKDVTSSVDTNTEYGIEEIGVDWQLVLTNLQREKKRNTARQEEQYVNRSLFFLDSSSAIREGFIKIAEARWFSIMSLSAILVNCIFMVYDDPVCSCTKDVCNEAEKYRRLLYLRDCRPWDSSLKSITAFSEMVFTTLFTVEMFIKIVARGFFMHKHAYLRDKWNWIDLIVVVFSIISLALPDVANVQVLRTVRVLRPLRTITQIQGMKPLIKTLVGAFKNIVNVISLLMFFFVVFGIFGSDLLSKKLRGRCFVDPLRGGSNDWGVVPEAILNRLESQRIPYIVESQLNPGSRFGGTTICSTDPIDDATMATVGPTLGGLQCGKIFIDGFPLNTTCSVMRWCGNAWCENWFLENPQDLGMGYVSYDNILEAFITIFQVLTNEGWTDLMYRLGNGWSVWGSRVFHSLWVIIGSFFVIQLALAVLADSFVQAQEDAKTEKEREALHDEAILRREDYDLKAKKAQIKNAEEPALYRNWWFMQKQLMGERLSKAAEIKNPVLLKIAAAFKQMQTWTRQLVMHKWFSRFILVVIVLNTIAMMLDHHDQNLFESSICRRRCEVDPMFTVGAAMQCTGPLFNNTWDTDGSGGGVRPVQNAFCFLADDATATFNYGWTTSTCSLMNYTMCDMEMGGNGLPCKWFPSPADSMGNAAPLGEGKCKASLFTSDDFASNAPIGLNGAVQTISLRHLCGDDGFECPTANVSMSNTIEFINVILTYIFIGEMAFKMFGMGLVDYFKERFNQFDFLVVISSIVDIVVTSQSSSSSTSGISSLRGMRLLRLFKLARSWKSMRKILNTLGIALSNLKALTIVWAMFMYIFALLCMFFFGGQFKALKTENPRSNFDSFGPSKVGHGAFLIVFQIISTENWNSIMYNTMQVGGWGGGVGTPALALIPIVIVLFGNYIIMNLFISILLQGFDEDDDNNTDDADDNGGIEASSLQPKVGPAQRTLNQFRAMLGPRYAKIFSSGTNSEQNRDSNDPLKKLARGVREGSISMPHPGQIGGGNDPLLKLALEAANKAQLESIVPEENRDDGLYLRINFRPFQREVKIPAHKALRLLPPNNYTRVFIAAIVQHPIFERIILVSILITSLVLCIDHPNNAWVGAEESCPRPPNFLDCSGLEPGQTSQINCPRSPLEVDWGRVWAPCDSPGPPEDIHPCCWMASQQNIYGVLDKVFTIIFFTEMILKMVADGIVFHQHAYLRNVWNWLDFVIVIISMISSFTPDTGGSLRTLKTLRTVRVLRPLRVIKRHPGLKIAVVCLISSLPAMGNVGVVVFVWFSMWAMFGVQLFKGKLYRCYDAANQVWYGSGTFPSGSLYRETPVMSGDLAVPTMIECVGAGGGGVGSWVDKPYSFNNYQAALLTCFAMATTEGWMDVLAAAVDATSPGVTPIPNIGPWAAVYCAFHIVLGAFVLLNLIVGSVINNYNRVKALNNGVTPFTTPEQQEWKETQRIIFNLKPMARKMGPSNPVRQWCFKVIHGPSFELVITIVIILNVISMMTRTHDQTDCWTTGIYWCNLVFLVVFVGEAVIKLLALGPQWYFLDGWNIFDFIVVLLSFVMFGLDTYDGDWTCDPSIEEGGINVPGLSVLRVFRIARVFRLVRRLKGLRQMIATLINSLPSLSNIAALIALILVIFSVLCVTFFYNVNTSQGGSLSESANYATFGNALYLLHRQTTGEAWNSIMADCAEDDLYKACALAYNPYMGDGCGGIVPSIIIHVFWQLFGTYTMMQLFTAVIIENFHELAKGEAFVLPMHKLSEFVDTWTELDPNASQKIDVGKIPLLIQKLPPPLGLAGKNATSATMMQVIKDLAIPIRDGSVTYKETFVACVKRVMEQEYEEDDEVAEEEEFSQGASRNGTTSHGGASARIVGLDDESIPPMFRGRRVTAAEDFAARSVQQGYRDWREKRLQVFKGVHKTVELPLNGNAKDIRPF